MLPPATLALLACLATVPDLSGAIASFEKGQVAEARPRLEAEAGTSPLARHYLGRIRLLEHCPEAALPLLESAAEAEPGRADFQFWLGVACVARVAEVGRFDQARLARKARACFLRACELAPDEPHPRLSLVRWFVEAPRIVGGSLERAREEAGPLLRTLPGVEGSLHRVFEAAARGFDRDRSRFCGRFEECPIDAPPRYQIGLLQLHVGLYEDARETFSAWLAAEPDAAIPLFQLGRTGALSGQHLEEARAALERYIKRVPSAGDPPLSAAHFRLGQVLRAMGDLDGERREASAALALAPDLVAARDLLDPEGGR